MRTSSNLEDLFIHKDLITYLLGQLSQPIVLVDSDGTIIWANQSFCDLLGYSIDELTSSITWSCDLTPSEYLDISSTLLNEVISTGQSKRFEKEYIKKDGSRIYVELLIHALFTPSNSLLCTYVLATDISERKRQEEFLDKINRMIFDAITDAICIFDRELRLRFTNLAAESAFDLTEDSIGKTFFDALPKANKIFYTKFLESIYSGQPVEFRAECYCTGKWIEVKAYPSDSGLVTYFRDITEKMQFEQELQRLDRLNVVGQMAAGISHEVRNPMTTIRGFLQMLSGKEECVNYKSYFDLMISEIDRANTIISEFLSVSKSSATNENLTEHCLDNILDRILPMLQADALENGIDLVSEIEQTSIIKVNDREICQLILNLTRNAFEAMPNGGKVIIKTFNQNNYVVLLVKDEGPGMPPEIISKLGTPFLTTKEKGTGLGLATCYSIVDRHNAKMTVTTGNEGTTFIIKFPLV